MSTSLIPKEISTYIRGFACLMIIFSHIGYFLFPGTNFLFPLSIAAGIGVDIFFFLSGYGLAQSKLSDKQKILVKTVHQMDSTLPCSSQDISLASQLLNFYKKRFLAIFPTLWLASLFIVVLDYIHPTLRPSTFLSGFTGILSSADIYKDFNSPLWYITLSLVWYAIFPLFWNIKRPLRTSILFLGSAIIIQHTLTFISLFTAHTLAFPIGVICAIYEKSTLQSIQKFVTKNYFTGTNSSNSIYTFIKQSIKNYSRLLFALFLIGVFCYCAFHSGNGTIYQEYISIVGALSFSIGLIFLYSYIKKVSIATHLSKIFIYIGTYSYEIYLIHWPLIYRHDILYWWLPKELATILYIPILLVIAFCIQKIRNTICNTFFEKNTKSGRMVEQGA